MKEVVGRLGRDQGHYGGRRGGTYGRSMDDSVATAEGAQRHDEILARCAAANAQAAQAVQRAEAAIAAAHDRLRRARATLDAIEERTARDRVAST
jgi:molecular chaperone GrpE (heat shock protein)